MMLGGGGEESPHKCSKCGKDPKILVADDIWISTIQNGKCLSCRTLEEAFKRDQENTCSQCRQIVGKKNLNQKKVCWGCRAWQNNWQKVKCVVCGEYKLYQFEARSHEKKCLSCLGKEWNRGRIASTIHKHIFPPVVFGGDNGINTGAGIPKIWQCPQCKVKKNWIHAIGLNDPKTVEQKLASKHKCQNCPKM